MQISINLGSDIMYVDGTVNGIETLFNSVDAHTFTADVKQSADDKYILDLELIDEAGNISSYKSTYEYILPFFVYDRTQEDVDRVKYLNTYRRGILKEINFMDALTIQNADTLKKRNT